MQKKPKQTTFWMMSKQSRVIIDNPLYTDTQYNQKVRYNDNLTVAKSSLKK